MFVNGNAGNDSLSSKVGWSTPPFGGAGKDTISALGAGSTQAIYGDKGNDLLSGAAQKATLYGGEGNDTTLLLQAPISMERLAMTLSIGTAANNSTAYGGSGQDTLQVVNGVSAGLYADMGSVTPSTLLVLFLLLPFLVAVVTHRTSPHLPLMPPSLVVLVTTPRTSQLPFRPAIHTMYYFGFGTGNDSLNFLHTPAQVLPLVSPLQFPTTAIPAPYHDCSLYLGSVDSGW